jgi:hypothetical protein
MDSLSTVSSSEYSSSATISSALILLAVVASSDGLSAELERTDITGRHYRFTPVLNTQNAIASDVFDPDLESEDRDVERFGR